MLILGESGTGKELVARAMHRMSPRAPKPFVAINCAALTETLLESELFGHEKGAFTGAVAQKKGKLELAEGGTVFLDEIGELAPQLQAKLLRVLQEREFERVGGDRTLEVERAHRRRHESRPRRRRSGAAPFREDLYHRLNVVALAGAGAARSARGHPRSGAALPGTRAAARCRRRVTGISEEAERCLRPTAGRAISASWRMPSSARWCLANRRCCSPEDLPETILESADVPAVPGALQTSVTQSKRELILTAWRETGGDHNEAAARLKIHPNSLRRLIRVLNLRDSL